MVTRRPGSNTSAVRLSGRKARRIRAGERPLGGALLMVVRGARFPRITGWPPAGLAGWVLVLGLTACSPVESYRSFVGVSLNDPDPAKSPFTQNLAAGDAMGYPNLATVPPPPTRATTTAERQKLTETLVANRTETEASVTAAAPPPANVTLASAKPRELAPCKTPMTASSTPAPAPPPRASESHQRKRGDPPEPQPLESSLQMPEARAAPEPEMPCAPLPPPNIPPIPSLAVAPMTPPAETIVAGMPVPPPPVPVIPEVSPPPASAKPPPKRPAAATPVAAIELPGTPPRIGADARAQIERVAALYKEEQRPVKVIGYAAPAAPGAPGGEPLAGYRAALERAQAVAAALRAAGIPADKVQAEAAPASARGSADRVEVQLLP